jgi:hypothetical protein
MSKVTKIETALRYLLVCAIFASPILPASAQQAGNFQTSGPTPDLSQSAAPLFAQPNYEGDLRQHCFFAGNYRDAVQLSVGYNDQALQYWKTPIWQNVPSLHTPMPISTGLIGDNIDTTVQGSVPGLVSAAVSGAVVGASALGAGSNAIGNSAAADTAGVSSAGSAQSVNGTVLDGTQF